MSAPGHRETEEGPPEAPEGAFDNQLTFPAPFVEAPQPIHTILKRDGREVPFEKAKIAEAIFKAAESIGGHDRDRAASLANGVAIYLTKILNGRPPTVDQVHDAVEKVLIEMGHARTALAYARYRDKRARMRQLRAGNLRALLKELAEAEGEPPPAPAGEESLFVRTSGESVATWDRAKIVEALVRETELDEHVANVIACDVEKQILSAGVRTLTAALVRELVDAKLVELGLEEHRRRHMRLGVPLYDAERILCAPNGGPGPQPFDPETTNGVLAEQVKREYALSRVFSQPVADAHLGGDIHLHHLGAIDRLHGIAPSLEFVKRFGGASGGNRPPRDVENLLGHLAQFTAGLQHHVSESITWEAINYYLAPFLPAPDEALLRSVARMLVFLLGHREPAPGRSAARVELGLSWDLPAPLRRKDAIGPGGKPVGRTYAECAETAQRLAWALLEAYAEAVEDEGRPPALAPVVRLTHDLFAGEGHAGFLAHAAAAAAAVPVTFVLDRSVLPEKDREQPWLPWRVSAHEVSINLPRLARGAGGEEDLCERLPDAVEMAVRAHREKQAFLRKLLDFGEVGPLALLAQHREGQRYVNPDRAVCYVTPVGLDECVRRIAAAGLHDAGGQAVALRLMEHLRVLCDRRTEREGFPIVPACGADARAAERFAERDLWRAPEDTRAVLDADLWTDDVRYTPGAGVAAATELAPLERARCDGALHDWAETLAPTVLPLPEDASGPSLASFLREAFFRTANGRLSFVPNR